MFQETYQQDCSSSATTLLNRYSTTESASSAKLTYNTFQTHSADHTACNPSSQSRKLAQVVSKFITPALGLVLENKGSVARDHLASERTYLAYVRTSLSCANAGVALVQLFKLSNPIDTDDESQGGILDLQRLARPLGVTMVLAGLLILAIGLIRYFMTQGALLRGLFPVARNSLAAVTFVLGAAVSLIFAVLFAEMRG